MKIGLTRVVVACAAIAGAQSLSVLFWPGTAALKMNLVLQLLLLLSFGAWSVAATRSYLNPPLLIVTAMYFWHSTFLTGHFLMPMETFQYTGATFTYGGEWIPQASALVTMSMLCTVVGVVGASRRERRLATRVLREVPASGTTLDPSATVFAWSCLGAFCALTVLYVVVRGIDRFGVSYMALYADTSEPFAERVYQSVKFFGAIAIMLVFVARRRPGFPIAPVAATAGLGFLGLLMGSRSIPFLLVLAGLVCLDRFVRRISVLEVVALAVLASALSFVIDHTREFGLGLQVFDLARTGRSIDLLHIVSNAGGVVKTLLRTMTFAGDNYLYGRSIADATLYLLPRFVVDGLGFGTGFIRPSEWLIARSADVKPGEGMGYSLIAEAYLNFGYIGCLLFAALGWYVGRQTFRDVFRHDRIAWLRASNLAVVLCLHLRNDLAASLRVLVYGYLLIAVLEWLDRRRVRVRFSWPLTSPSPATGRDTTFAS